MSRVCLAVMAAVCLSSAGCTITDTSIVNTGLFDGDLQKLSDAYEKLDKLERNKATIDDVRQLGFDVGNHRKTPNIQQLPGPAAFQLIFGSTVYQGALMDPKNGDKLLEESQHYKAFFVPFRNIVTYTDRYYFSTKETLKQGDDLMIAILFRDNKLFYCDYKYLKIDTRDSTNAFAQGLIDILVQYLGPASALNNFINQLKDQINPPKN